MRSATLVILGVLVTTSAAFFCGKARLAVSLEVKPNGAPSFRCMRPVCGSSWRSRMHRDVTQKIPNIKKSTKEQDGFYGEETSPSFAPFNRYQVADAPERGSFIVGQGEKIQGREVYFDGEYYFDFLKDVEKLVDDDGQTAFNVTIGRLHCRKIQKNLPPSQRPQAFQTPILQATAPKHIPSEFPDILDRRLVQNQVELTTQAFREPKDDIPVEESQNSPQNPAAEPDFSQQNAVPEQQNAAFQQENWVPQHTSQQNFVAPQQQQFAQQASQQSFSAHQNYGYQSCQPQGNVLTSMANMFTGQTQTSQAQVYCPPAASYYPVSGVSGMFCFTEDTMVKTADGRKIRMDEITLKDWLLSFNGSNVYYSKMESWLHRIPKLKTEFLKMEFDDGKILKLTSKHYIYKTSCTAQKTSVSQLPKHAVLAEQVEEGDCLFTVAEGNKVHESRVVRIDTVEQTGIYAPMTASGNIVVNDVLASCHSVLDNDHVHKAFMYLVDMYTGLKSFVQGKEHKTSDLIELPIGTGFLLDVVSSVMPAL
ncbi:hypothetical protein L596_019732 [Steinernema carpocapsae]|uniref:Hint domain-containing protein n=1 Tax=Steinernema carpocapsae TaxID=34508 RepID=A0A4U5MRF5_STECR|nr:hypothetical protein L596_019732 [Steinernema carpocapsae]